jgi:hypothetical protein
MQPRSHIHIPRSAGKFEGMNPHTPKWAPILRVGVMMDSQIFRKQFEGSNLLDYKVPYTIKKFFET